jgi:M-phase inducer tyrosine phosphatase
MATMFAQPQPRAVAPPRPRDDYDVSSDLELSFASSISLNSPPRSPQDSAPIHGEQLLSPVPMDIYESPALPRPNEASASRQSSCRSRPPIATAGRTFGRDVANASRGSLGVEKLPQSTYSDKLRSRQRTALPAGWPTTSPEPASAPLPEKSSAAVSNKL